MSASNFSPDFVPEFSSEVMPEVAPPSHVPTDSSTANPLTDSSAAPIHAPTYTHSRPATPLTPVASTPAAFTPVITGDRSGFEPELGSNLRQTEARSGFEPELGGLLRQTGVYVDELTCIGCKHCALVARNTFYIEPDLGRARVVNQTGDHEDLIQEAIDTCPVNCIHWVDFTQLKQLEQERQYQVISRAGLPLSSGRSRQPKRSNKAH